MTSCFVNRSKGVVRDPKVHEEVIARVIDGAGTMGWEYVLSLIHI